MRAVFHASSRQLFRAPLPHLERKPGSATALVATFRQPLNATRTRLGSTSRREFYSSLACTPSKLETLVTLEVTAHTSSRHVPQGQPLRPAVEQLVEEASRKVGCGVEVLEVLDSHTRHPVPDWEHRPVGGFAVTVRGRLAQPLLQTLISKVDSMAAAAVAFNARLESVEADVAAAAADAAAARKVAAAGLEVRAYNLAIHILEAAGGTVLRGSWRRRYFPGLEPNTPGMREVAEVLRPGQERVEAAEELSLTWGRLLKRRDLMVHPSTVAELEDAVQSMLPLLLLLPEVEAKCPEVCQVIRNFGTFRKVFGFSEHTTRGKQ